jgi:hypothetical protein
METPIKRSLRQALQYLSTTVGSLLLLPGSIHAAELHPPEKLRYELGVSEERHAGYARVRVTLLGNGAQPIYQGSVLSVNGHALQEQALRKQGVWYTANIPLAEHYAFAYVLSTGATAMTHLEKSRAFHAALPTSISISQGASIAYTLGEESGSSSVVLEIKPLQQTIDPMNRQTLRLEPLRNGQFLRVEPSSWSTLRPGSAEMNAIHYAKPYREGKISSRFAAYYRATVNITE